ncbi:hypothetical protein GCM10027168_51150 [Streptomyces capparidis]
MTTTRETTPTTAQGSPRHETAAPAAATAWSRPDYRIVETSLEVTAYGLNTR